MLLSYLLKKVTWLSPELVWEGRSVSIGCGYRKVGKLEPSVYQYAKCQIVFTEKDNFEVTATQYPLEVQLRRMVFLKS